MTNLSYTITGVNSNLENSQISFHAAKQDFVNASNHTADWHFGCPKSIAAVAELVTTAAWSPIIWQPGYRKAENFKFADWGALDFDGYPQDEFEQIMRDWCDTVSVIVTTKRDSPQLRRFRIVFPFERRISVADQYTFNLDELVKRYDCDESGTNASRFFWSGTSIVQCVEEGYFQPVKTLPCNYRPLEYRAVKAFNRYSNMGRSGFFPSNIALALRGINVDGQRNDQCYFAAKYLTYWGMPADEIQKTILNSKLPLKNSRSLKEAAGAIERGIRKAKKIEEVAKRGCSDQS